MTHAGRSERPTSRGTASKGDAQPAPPATILDVAALAGVSRTTVSRFLNHPEVVPAGTAQRVLDAVNTLQFKPNPRARGMRTGRSETIALLVGDAAQPFHSALAKAVACAAESRGLSMLLCDLDHKEATLVKFLRRLPPQGVDGIIVATGDDLSDEASALIRETQASGTPVVISGRGADDDPNAVGVDFEGSARTATEILLEGGSVRPVLLLGDSESYVGARWTEGYRAAMATAGHESMILQTRYSTSDATDLTLALLAAAEDRVDGIVATTVPLALAAMRAAHRAELHVPEDLAVIACEEVGLADLVTPAISTVGVTPEASAAALVRQLCARIDSEAIQATGVPLVTTRRDTTRSRAAK